MADLEDGESVEMQGSAAKPYVIKNVGGVYSCSCPAWRNQSTAIEQRTCKHIRKLRGDEAEKERTGGVLPVRATKASGEGPPLLLAQTWDCSVDLVDWWMSEKLDGVRAFWDGKKFLSRQGNQFLAPDWFVAGLPNTPLDGELWIDRKKFQRTVSVVRRQDQSDHWKEVRFLVFDAPRQERAFEERIEFLNETVSQIGSQYVEVHEHQRCKGLNHLQEELARVEALGGEGLMLRQPASLYEAGRSFTLLKVKTFHDAEAVVIDHVPGKGKHKGRLGAVVAQLPDGTEFSVGTGFSDAERDSPPGIGSTITFRYQELSDSGVPRFPSFLRLAKGASAGTPVAASGAGAAKATRAGSSKMKTKTETATAKTSVPAKEIDVSDIRYFEFVDAKSSKFWEISQDGADVTVRYGRLGANGQTKTKSFDDDEQATTHYEKMIEQKTGKGYEETDRPDD